MDIFIKLGKFPDHSKPDGIIVIPVSEASDYPFPKCRNWPRDVGYFLGD
jgi:hypothetical protein